MSKVKKVFLCQNCGSDFLKWLGQCPNCKEWNSITEEVLARKTINSGVEPLSRNVPINLSSIDPDGEPRFSSSDKELDRVLGGGIVPGSLVLFGGEPGIGKSTLLLQVALSIKEKVLYISGEESAKQVRLRADRMEDIPSSNCLVLTETNLESIVSHVKKEMPRLIMVDSIQTLHSSVIESSAGSVSQIRECTNILLSLAKQYSIATFLVGHITKDGAIAGPKILEHMVDTVLQFEGDRNHLFRILRVFKNRFGTTNELGIYQMVSSGLKAVTNPSQLFVSKNSRELSGIATGVAMEGVRPLVIEIQALVSSSIYSTPQRTTTGFNIKRLNMLLAVMEKRAGFKLAAKDVFLNIAGGINIEDPAIDLAVICSVLSSNADIALTHEDCFCAEVGLAGEIRPVPKIDQRIQEAEKLGYERILVSKYNKMEQDFKHIEVLKIGTVSELVNVLFC